MALEIFTQLTATGDQLEQQYRLRKRFCLDHLKWRDRNHYHGMEYDQYDHPGTVYLIWRDEGGTARGMARFTSCDQPFMIKDVWPHLVTNCDMPNRANQWEATRLCIEPELGSQIPLVICQIMHGAELIAHHLNIDEYWWLSPKERINKILSHNHTYVGPGEQAGDEFCFVGYSDARQMVMPALRTTAERTPTPSFVGIAA